MKVKVFVSGPLQVNCSILYKEESSSALFIDPGGNASQILDFCKQQKITPTMILHTHAHFDHINGTHEIFQLQPNCLAQTYLHEEDLYLWQHFSEIAAGYGIPVAEPKATVHHFVNDGDTIEFLDYNIKVLHTPGHSPGSVCYYMELKQEQQDKEYILFSGDTLFRDSVGRTDLWRGDHDQLLHSIKNKLYTLPEQTVVLPGHGEATTIGREKKENFFTK